MLRVILMAWCVVLCAGCNAADTVPAKSAAAVAATVNAAPVTAAAVAIRFSATEQSGQFDLENTGADVSVRSRLQVEKRVGDQWRPVASELYVADACMPSEPPTCRTFKAKEKVRLLRYEGFTCSMACPPGCMANAQLSPGSFRLVALSCDGTQRFVSAGFDLK
jgi:hypothetical protein